MYRGENEMYNKLPNTNNGGNLTMILIPIMLALSNTDLLKSTLNGAENLGNKVDMLKDIKPFFSVKEQYLLSKIEDVLEIFNKINRIQKETYSEELSVSTNTIPKKERKEKILENMAKYFDDENRGLIQKVIDTNKKIEETKSNVMDSNIAIQNNDSSSITTILKLLDCMRPLFRDIDNKKIKKIDKIIELVNIPEDHF